MTHGRRNFFNISCLFSLKCKADIYSLAKAFTFFCRQELEGANMVWIAVTITLC